MSFVDFLKYFFLVPLQDNAKEENKKGVKRKRVKSETSRKQGSQNPVRIEQLNYKVCFALRVSVTSADFSQRIVVGMKILCQVMEIKSLGLIVSLPYQLMGHIPITQITTQLTNALEAEELRDSNGEDSDGDDLMEQQHQSPPELHEIFRVGQFVRAVVTAVRSAGTTERNSLLGFSHEQFEKASMRVELSLIPGMVNSGLEKTDFRSGFVSLQYLLSRFNIPF